MVDFVERIKKKKKNKKEYKVLQYVVSPPLPSLFLFSTILLFSSLLTLASFSWRSFNVSKFIQATCLIRVASRRKPDRQLVRIALDGSTFRKRIPGTSESLSDADLESDEQECGFPRTERGRTYRIVQMCSNMCYAVSARFLFLDVF